MAVVRKRVVDLDQLDRVYTSDIPNGDPGKNLILRKKEQREVTIARRYRSKDEEVRVNYCTFTREDGEEFDYVDIRVFSKKDGRDWMPGERGVSIRLKELKRVKEALDEAIELASVHFT